MYPILWLGGSPCSGKSAAAARLSDRFGHRIYECDDAYYRHQHLVAPERQPIFSRLSALSGDDLWMRPASQQIEEELELYREEFSFILADILAIAAAEPVIAEGAALLPELLAGLGIAPSRAIWMVPSAAFQRAHYAQRPWRHEVLGTCSNPEQAWENWMDRDAGFAQAVTAQARRHGYRLLTIDGSQPFDEVYDLVEAHLDLGA